MNKIIFSTILLALLAGNAMAGGLLLKPYARLDAGYSAVRDFESKDFLLYHKGFTHNAPMFGAGFGLYLTPNSRADVTLSYRVNYEYRTRNVQPEINTGSLEPIWQKNVLIRQRLSVFSAMANGYYDLPLNSYFTPYVTIGAGAAIVRTGDYTSHETGMINSTTPIDKWDRRPGKNTSNFAWSTGLGFKTKIDERIGFDFGYKYVDMGKFYTTIRNYDIGLGEFTVKTLHSKLRAHEFGAGLRFDF
jgi:opacity protein-like surface antigen